MLHNAPPTQQFATYPFRYDSFDFKIAWKTSPTPQGTVVEGIMKNVRYTQVEDLEVTVSVLNQDKKRLASATAFLIPRPFNLEEYRDFSLMLKDVALGRGDLLHFLIQYRAIDASKSTLKWVTTFTVDALTGAAIIPPEEGSTGL